MSPGAQQVCVSGLTWHSAEQLRHPSQQRFYQRERLPDPSTGTTSPQLGPGFNMNCIGQLQNNHDAHYKWKHWYNVLSRWNWTALALIRMYLEPLESRPLALTHTINMWYTSASIASFSVCVCRAIACRAVSWAPMACSVALAELAREFSRRAATAANRRTGNVRQSREKDGEQRSWKTS